jgi:4-nitrophenyl phosphatase
MYMGELSQIRGMIIDLDGVLWRGNTTLPGVQLFFRTLTQMSIPFILATNNATQKPELVQERLATLDIAINNDQVLTSGQAAAEFLGGSLPLRTPILMIGEEALREALIQRDFVLVENPDEAQAVLVGFDRQCTWDKLAKAALAIQSGALFVGTNPDVSFPIEGGEVPGTGAILAALRESCGIQPTIIGKPEPHLYSLALKRLQIAPEVALAIGDRLETDILGGKRVGMKTALILTGITQSEDLEQSSIQPDYVFHDLSHLCGELSR